MDHSRASSTTGTLIRKTARRPSPSTRAPPTRGPAGRARPRKPAHTPIARARAASSGKARPMRASLPGNSGGARGRPGPPGRPRAPPLWARPQAREPAPKTPRPVSTTRLWPYRSPAAPLVARGRRAPARIRRRPPPAGVPPSPPTSVPRSEPMAGRATSTTVTSSSTRKYPAHITARTVRGDPEFPGDTPRRSSVTGAAALFPSYQAALTVPGAREPYGDTIRGGRRCRVTSVRRPSAAVAVM